MTRRIGPWRKFVQDPDDPSDQGRWMQVFWAEAAGTDGKVRALSVAIPEVDPIGDERHSDHWFGMAEFALEHHMREQGVWPS